MNQKVRKLIPVLIIILAAVVCIIWIIIQQLAKTDGNCAEVRVSGETVMTLPLDTPSRHKIHGANGIELVVVVEGGCVFVEHSDCPDKICENMGKKSSVGETIICLPAQTVIEIRDN